MLDPLEQATLVAIYRLTRESHNSTDSEVVERELRDMGFTVPEGLGFKRLMMRLRDEGYLTPSTFFGGSGDGRFIELTGYGKAAADTRAEPVEATYAAARRFIASDRFAAAYPDAFGPWADAERLLFDEDESELTTIGHKIREAAQGFASLLIARHGAKDPPDDVKRVKARLGAVIALHRERLGPKRRAVLEAMGDLWEVSVDLIERQEHAAQKEGEPVTLDDARRIVYLTMFLMIEFATMLDA